MDWFKKVDSKVSVALGTFRNFTLERVFFALALLSTCIPGFQSGIAVWDGFIGMAFAVLAMFSIMDSKCDEDKGTKESNSEVARERGRLLFLVMFALMGLFITVDVLSGTSASAAFSAVLLFSIGMYITALPKHGGEKGSG